MSNLNEAQNELFEFMSDLSEEAWCAGWMSENEYWLWAIVVGNAVEWGRLDIAVSQVDRLRALSRRVGGWIEYVGDDTIPREQWGERFVPMNDWLAQYAAFVEAHVDLDWH